MKFKNYKTKKVKIKGIDHKLWIADSFDKRKTGLSLIKNLPSDCGMLFIYDKDTSNSFTMKNTAIPLCLIFIDSDFNIVSQYNCQPFQKQPINPGRPYRYVIEVNP